MMAPPVFLASVLLLLSILADSIAQDKDTTTSGIIPIIQRRTGISEEDMDNSLCGKSMFTCRSIKKCVPLSRVCDGHDTCGDNSDEADCGKPKVTMTTAASSKGGVSSSSKGGASATKAPNTETTTSASGASTLGDFSILQSLRCFSCNLALHIYSFLLSYVH